MTDTLGQPEVTETTTTYTVDYGPQTTTNGHPPPPPPRPGHDTPPSSSSRHSLASASTNQDAQLVSRKQTQHTTQQITTTTKVIREVQHITPDGQVLDTYTLGEYPAPPPPPRPDPGYAMDPYRPHSPSSEAGSRGRYEGGYEYDPYSRGPPPPTLQDYPYEQQPYQPSQPNQPTQPGYSGRYRDPPAGNNYNNHHHHHYPARPPTPPSPSDCSEGSPPPGHTHPGTHPLPPTPIYMHVQISHQTASLSHSASLYMLDLFYAPPSFLSFI
ncbi:hypothetical protein Pmani_022407 [Petrolisthes manimaculis]|uniref:Uncharacterized protein n=1 Tax=Petrolisthes manimaculis TaxID=1843537 RepID=A0AAE1U4E9_9EUCA|nr:hypothetical protein Pmani_022407 [Petrolisthes manimaculis]